ncbi:MAG: undecaprenyl-diphosphate phosphatase [Bacteroidales bacterium]|nr:undecaprenyl-diphosphate phosphatase [Bacteroidales bacterium]
MDWLQAIILGVVQGLTEFLPVSSSGHLAIFKELLGVEASEDLMFEVTVHAATVLATIVVFWKPIVQLFAGLFKFRYNDETDYICKLLVGTIPILIVGLFFKDQVEELFSSLWVVGGSLLITAVLLYFSDTVARSKVERENTARGGISFVQALLIGIGQAFAVLPGLSRSGATISTGLIAGVRREVVAQFSFIMVIIPILGEMVLALAGGELAASSTGLLPLALGFLSAFITGLFACKAMMALVRRAQLKWFALYCVTVGFIVILTQIL